MAKDEEQEILNELGIEKSPMTGEEWLKNNPPLETPTFFSV